jgi:hypothetical protein
LKRRNGGWYCSKECFNRSRAAFSFALESGILDRILELPEVQDKFQGARRYSKLQAMAEKANRPHAALYIPID